MLKVVSDQKDLCSVVLMCFLIYRISSIPSAEDFAFICLDILMLVLLVPDLVFHITGPDRLGHSTLVIIVAFYSPPIKSHAFCFLHTQSAHVICTRDLHTQSPCSPC
jgi:hypothetical protein